MPKYSKLKLKTKIVFHGTKNKFLNKKTLTFQEDIMTYGVVGEELPELAAKISLAFIAHMQNFVVKRRINDLKNNTI